MSAFVDIISAHGKDWQSHKMAALALQRDMSFKLYKQSTTENTKVQQSRQRQLLA